MFLDDYFKPCRWFQLLTHIGSMLIDTTTSLPVSWGNLRIPGVLQRLALAYLVVACLDLLVARAHLEVYTTVS